jgi:hypothetical protein
MMDNNFDLNINNYTIKELEEILELPFDYNDLIIKMKGTKLRQSIVSNKKIMSETKSKTIEFIENVKHKLIENYENTNKLGNKIDNIYNLDNTLKPSEFLDANSKHIIKAPTTPFGNSAPSEFYPGTLNPLNKRILKQNINIDTRFRENYYSTVSSNFHLDLPIRFNKVVSLQLSALELPSTFYVISQAFGTNYFTLQIENEPPLIVTVPDGNYDYLSLEMYINDFLLKAPLPYKLIQAIADVNTPNGGGPPGGSGKMIFGWKNENLMNNMFSINFQTDRFGNEDKLTPLPLKLGWLMGYRHGFYENNTTYVSEGIINLLGPRYIYLVVDDYNNSVSDGFYGAFTASVLNKNILARISLQGSVFNFSSKDNFNLITTPRQYFGPVDIQKLQIQLLDEYGRILNLNNMDFSFCLTFQTVYDL